MLLSSQPVASASSIAASGSRSSLFTFLIPFFGCNTNGGGKEIFCGVQLFRSALWHSGLVMVCSHLCPQGVIPVCANRCKSTTRQDQLLLNSYSSPTHYLVINFSGRRWYAVGNFMPCRRHGAILAPRQAAGRATARRRATFILQVGGCFVYLQAAARALGCCKLLNENGV